jgi:uncharacterized membrane protein
MGAEQAPPPARERKSIQFVLRGGLFLATISMAIGFVLELLQRDLESRPLAVASIFSSATPVGDRWMGLGILLLSLTPAVRVLALFVLWVQEKDWRFAGVALAVMATLAAAIALGGG